MGSSLPPFQTSMSSSLGQAGMGSALDAQKSTGLFGIDNKNTSISSGGSPFKNNDLISSGGPGVPMDHSTGIRERRLYVKTANECCVVEQWISLVGNQKMLCRLSFLFFIVEYQIFICFI